MKRRYPPHVSRRRNEVAALLRRLRAICRESPVREAVRERLETAIAEAGTSGSLVAILPSPAREAGGRPAFWFAVDKSELVPGSGPLLVCRGSGRARYAPRPGQTQRLSASAESDAGLVAVRRQTAAAALALHLDDDGSVAHGAD